ncbi:MAG: EAL domain-containing protein [Hyphomicrobiales bacterium]|nr:EAL domain-containing protein [Hyphomicrobiales bacterium]
MKAGRTCGVRSLASLTGVVSAVVVGYFGWLSPLDFKIYDIFVQTFHENAPSDIIIVAVDEKSVSELGAWPWSRAKHAALTRILNKAGAKAIALDFVFAERSTSDPQGDEELIRAVKESGRVILPVAFDQLTEDSQLIEILPFPGLLNAAAGLGHVDIDVASDGITRFGFLYAGLGQAVWPAYAKSILDVAEGRPPALRHESQGRSGGIENPFVWTRSDRVLIPFIGPPGHFVHKSFLDVLRGQVPDLIFQNAYVLVGATSITLSDRIAVPGTTRGRLMSGIELNANFLHALREGTVLSPVERIWVALTSAAFVLVLGGLALLGFPAWSLLGAGVIGACGLSLGLMHAAHMWIGPAAASAGSMTTGLMLGLLSRRLKNLRAAEERSRTTATLNAVSDGVITLNEIGVIERMNAVAGNLLGVSAAEIIGLPADTALRLSDEKSGEPLRIQDIITKMPRGRPSLTRDASLPLPDGSQRLLQLSITVPQARASSGSVMTITDKTDLHRMAQAIAKTATRDEITRLPNRRVFLQQLARGIARAQQSEGELAVIVVDVDRFLKFNDTFGYDAGDALLKAIAQRLQDLKNPATALARIGADSFALMFEDVTISERVLFQAHRLRNALHQPYSIHGFQASITASVGVGLHIKHGGDTDTLLASAESAVLSARSRGGNAVEFYPGKTQVHDLKTVVIKRRVKDSMRKKELEIYYQPQFDLIKNEICGAEALLRWKLSKYWTISPGEFLPYIEEYGMMESIGDWVMKQACHDLKHCQQLGWNNIRISVNLSLQQLLDPDLPTKIKQYLYKNKIDGQFLILEITESNLISDFDRAIKNIYKLRNYGVDFYIDDFGVGYTSLAYLKKLPVNGLKIDKSFVQSAVHNQEDYAVFTAIIVIARAMNLRLVAEGIETQQQLDFVRSQRCDEAQGFLISEAIALPKFLAYLAAHAERPDKSNTNISLTS